MGPDAFGDQSTLVVWMANGRGVCQSLYFSTVLQLMAETVALESNRIRTWCLLSGCLSGEISPDINRAVSFWGVARAAGVLGRSRFFRGPDVLLLQLIWNVGHFPTLMPTGQICLPLHWV